MMKFLVFPIVSATLSLAGCSQAQDVKPVSGQASIQEVLTAGNWTVIDADSHLKFTAKQQGNDFTGHFDDFETVINFDPNNLTTASVTTTIDIASISAGDKDRDGALPGKEWFYVKKFPKAVFQSSNFSKTGDDTYEAAGTLSIKGASHPLTLPFNLTITDGIADMTGQVTIDRTLWGLGGRDWSTDEWVSTAVIIDVKIRAEANN